MKKLFRLPFFLLIVSLIISSCVASLYPISEDEKDFVFKKELIGHWLEGSNDEEYIIDTSAKFLYKIIVISKNDSSENLNAGPRTDTVFYKAFLVNIKGKYYLDCTPHIDPDEAARKGLLPLHYIFNIQNIQQNSILISGINKDMLMDLINKRKISIKHEELSDGDVLLTEKPISLRQKLSGAVSKSLFDNPSLLTRKN